MGTKWLTDSVIDEICSDKGFDELDLKLVVSVDKLPNSIKKLKLNIVDQQHVLDQWVMNQFDAYDLRSRAELIELMRDDFPDFPEKIHIELISVWRECFNNEYGHDPWKGTFAISIINLHTEASVISNMDFDDDAKRLADSSNGKYDKLRSLLKPRVRVWDYSAPLLEEKDRDKSIEQFIQANKLEEDERVTSTSFFK